MRIFLLPLSMAEEHVEPGVEEGDPRNSAVRTDEPVLFTMQARSTEFKRENANSS
jgi:hypothetical protein